MLLWHWPPNAGGQRILVETTSTSVPLMLVGYREGGTQWKSSTLVLAVFNMSWFH